VSGLAGDIAQARAQILYWTFVGYALSASEACRRAAFCGVSRDFLWATFRSPRASAVSETISAPVSGGEKSRSRRQVNRGLPLHQVSGT
jgi:hypothetical protein